MSSNLSLDQLLEELIPQNFKYLEGLFDAQRDFILDKSQYKVVLTPGRCGKTYALVRHLLYNASVAAPEAVGAYVCDTRKHGRQLILEYLSKLVPMHQIDMSDLVVKVGRSRIEIFSADDDRKKDRMRGIPYSIVVIDEAQSLNADLLESLILDVVTPRLQDYRAPLILTGTPGEIPHGYFHKVSTEPEKFGWSMHRWDQYNNIHFPRWAKIKDPEERRKHIDDYLFQEMATRYGGQDNPKFIREMLGRWTLDPDRLIYHLSSRNHADFADHRSLTNFLAVDLGYRDATAWVVLGHDSVSGKVRMVFERQERGRSVEEVIEITRSLVEKYNPDRVWVDAAGIGTMVLASLAAEIRRRWDIPVVAAEKSDKAVVMRMLDNDCRTGSFLLPEYSETYKQMFRLCWDDRRQREAEGQDCDLADACLYAYRSCTHYLKSDVVEEKEEDKSRDEYYRDLFFKDQEEDDDWLFC